ncbi:ABC transporter permease subunit, partial [Romboutsia sp.]|uniref:ABC transporter permease subunit n=1 Tax=Romboutsia sp. TaxID=1965302 RepID=UPI002C662F89
KSFTIWTIVLIGLLSLFMALFPSMSNSSMTEIMQAKMDALPQSMLAAFGIETIDFTDLLQYFSYTGQYILIATCIYAGILGANSLIKEESEGTIEFLYAQPISREKIVTIKLFATFTILYIMNIVLFVVTMIFFEMFKPDNYEYLMDLIFIYKGMFLAQFVFLGLGFFISTIIKKVSSATPIMLGIFFSTYMLGIFSTIIEKLEWLKYLSPVHYVMPSEILKNNGNIELSYMIICVVIIVISILLTFYRYKRKDFEM